MPKKKTTTVIHDDETDAQYFRILANIIFKTKRNSDPVTPLQVHVIAAIEAADPNSTDELRTAIKTGITNSKVKE